MEIPIKIKALRKALKFTQKQLSAATNIDQGTISNWELGKSAPTVQQNKILAKLQGMTDQEWLFGEISSIPLGAIALKGKDHYVPVLGQVQAGAWRPIGETVDPHNATKFVTFFNADYPIDKQYALKVIGDSMNLVIFENSFVICINIDDGISSPTHGDIVVAEHIEDGQVETTVKKLALTLDGVTLLPCSSNEDYKPLVLNNLPNGCEVKIKARVIGAVQEF